MYLKLAEKLKECQLKLVVQEGIHKRFWLAEWRQHDGSDQMLNMPDTQPTVSMHWRHTNDKMHTRTYTDKQSGPEKK